MTEERSQRWHARGERALDITFWLTLGVLLLLYLSQFRTPWWLGWSPQYFGYPAAHVTAAGWMMAVWYLKTKGQSAPRWATAVAFVSIFTATGAYFLAESDVLVFRGSFGSTPDMLLAVLLVATTLYIAYLYWGPVFPALGIFFIGYLFFVDRLPAPFTGPDLEWRMILSRMANKVFGSQVELSARFLWALVFWGLLLNTAGGGVVVLTLARFLSRVLSGGPAMGAVAASAFAGSFVGGGPSNVAITGPVTIPAMKQAGYTPAQAGAFEALASNASAITPPILGVVAFVMADLIGVSYIEIIKMSLLPAALWFLALGVYIYANAKRHSDTLTKLSMRSDADWWLNVRSAFMVVVPVAMLVWTVQQGNTLRIGSLLALASLAVLAPVMRVEKRWSVYRKGIENAAFYASSVTLILLIITLIADSIKFTGLGVGLGEVVNTLSGGSVLVAGIIMIVLGVFLGGALPSLAIYFVMAITFAPILFRLGIDFRVSHYTAFYIGNLSLIIPPVAGSALVAAAIAQSTYRQVSWEITKMSWPMWVFPLFFLVAPELLGLGETDLGLRLLIIVSTAMVLTGVQAATAGWLLGNTHMLGRLLLYANFILQVYALNNRVPVAMAASVVVVIVVAGIGALSSRRSSKIRGVVEGQPEPAPSGGG